MSVLSIEDVSFAYDRNTPVIRNLSWNFEEGNTYAIIGRSGAGKTTLLSLMSGLLKPIKGKILFNGKDISHTNQFVYRSRDIGVVFQNYNLLPKLTATENVVLSMEVSRTKGGHRNKKARELLAQMGLTESEMKRRILLLSGGQQQRVAIARAISYDAKVILADEPTGNLDVITSREIMHLLNDLAHDMKKCVVIVTHSPAIADMSDCIVDLSQFSASSGSYNVSAGDV